MSLGLNQSCLDRLSVVLAEQLSKLTVNNRMFLDRGSTVYLLFAEGVLPQNGKLRTVLEQFISETPIYDFVYETLSRELYESQEYDSKAEVSGLSEIDGYVDLTSVAKRLVLDFESLPWDYSLSVPMPQAFNDVFATRIRRHALSDSITLLSPDEAFLQKFPLRSGIEKRDRALKGGLGSLFLTGAALEWDQKATYMQFQFKGFVGKYGGTIPLDEATALMRAFYGLGIALRLFKINPAYRSTPTKARFFIHRKIGKSWVIERTDDLEASQSNAIADLVLHDLEGAIDTDDKREGWIRKVLESIALIFSRKERSRNIILGAQWLFDSYCGSDELLSFVQTAVVMEILLGDKAISDLTGLGELLANRCAYLISNSHKERERILRDFRAIYEVRSKIVHRGKSRLTLAERTLFTKLQWMCRRVIHKDVELLEKDAVKDA